MDAFLSVLMRWIHVTSAAIAIGGAIYARFGAGTEGNSEAAAARFRPWAVAAALGLVGAGFYNFFTKGFYPSGYHMWFGIKMLLALHVLAVLVLLAIPGRGAEKRMRMMGGVAWSGLAITAISAWLRWLTLLPRS